MAETFVTREGTIDHGKEFETLHVANYVLNLVQDVNVKNFHLSSNDKNYGAFDDIVVDIETEKGRQVYALQLKHKENGTLKINDLLNKNGNFGIQKYFNSFNSIENKNQKFILYTNLKCTVKIDKPFQLQGEDFLIKLIKVNFDDIFKISDRTDSCYKFLVVENSSSEKAAKYKKFFNSFWLCTNQENAHQLHKRVSNTFKTAFAANETESDAYLKFVTNWCGINGRKEKLNKEWMQHVIALIILSSRVKPLSFEPIRNEVKIFQKTIDEFDITVFENDSCEKVVKLWGDANTKPYDTKELNQLRKKFQIFDTFISDIDTVDVNIASKLLWLMGTCPLIVIGDETVYKAIELCPNKKFILLEENSTKHPQSFSSIFRRLSDLDQKSDIFLELIKTCSCSLQGKNKLSLEHVIKENRKFLEAIRTDSLLEMIVGVCNIGGEKETLPEPYIERYLVQNVIDLSYLESLKQDTIVIVDCVEKKVLKNSQNKLICIDNGLLETTEETTKFLKLQSNDDKKSQHFNSTIYYSTGICFYSSFISITEKHKNSKIHHFRFNLGRFEWIRSKGDVNDLQKYKTDLLIEETKLFASRPNEYINLIIADPGMGKSELMKSLKNNCSSDLWTVIVFPKDVVSFCNKIAALKNVVKIFDDFVFSGINDLDKVFFQNCVEQNKVVYIWDALDEITENQLKIVVKIILELSSMKRVQWVTSRYHLKNFLESEFSTVAFSLTEFDIQTQKLYIEKRLQINKEIEIFEKIRSSFVLVDHKNILGIPLQLYMITELFRQNNYLSLLTDQFVLTDLYFHFIEEKIKIYLVQKVGLPFEIRLAESLHYDAITNLQKLALTLLFSTEMLQSLDVTVEINELKKQDCLAIGLVTDLTNQNPRFIHNSFAEYLVAVFFSKNYHKFKNVLKDVLFESRFLNVRFFFDLLLAQNCPIHIAVLYKNINLLKSYEKDISTSKDEGGRNALHLACSWGQKHPTLKVELIDNGYTIDDDYTSNVTPETEINKLLVEYLLNICDILDADTMFDMKPLTYAQKSGNLLGEIKIMTKLGINIFTLDDQHAANILYYSTLLGYDEVIDLFQTNDQENENRTTLYVNIKNIQNFTLLLIACDRGYEKIVEFLVMNGCEVDFANKDGITPLYMASENGYKKIVEFLVANGSQVNLANKKGATPLHIASLKNEKTIVEFLVKNKAQINFADEYGWTPLHVASLNGYVRIVEFLVVNGSQVNLAEQSGWTPLHAASENDNKSTVEFLVANGSQIDLTDENGATPLYIASKNGYKRIVEFLVANGSQVNLADKHGYTPLFVACQYGHEETVEFLVANGSQVNLADKDGVTPLYVASQNGYEKVIEILVTNGAQVNLGKEDGWTPLHTASHKGYEKIVEYLVANGSQVNLANKYGVIPLHIASFQGYKKIVKFLVKNGSQVNLAEEDGFTPLYMASENGHKETVKFLVANGSQVNLAKNDGVTPLSIASQNGHQEIVEFLVANGSQVNLANKYGIIPLHVASFQGYKKIVEFLVKNGSQVKFAEKDGFTPLYMASKNGHKETVKFLVANGSQVNLTEEDGWTPLHGASENGHKSTVEFLVANGSQINLTDKNGATPLYIASKNGHKTTAEVLVANGSEINLATEDGLTPLHIASQNGHKSIVKILIANGSKVNLTNKNGATPLYLACENNHKETVELLVANGSKVNLAKDDGWTPLYIASDKGYNRIVELLVANGSEINHAIEDGWTPLHVASANSDMKIVEFLVANGSQVNLTNKNGTTPLYLASENDHKETVEFLVANGAEVDLAKKDGWTPLYIASHKGYNRIVELLVANGSEINLAIEDGWTPLHIASVNGDIKMVEFLVANGSQVNLANKNGATPLYLATQNGHQAIIEFLEANGGQVNTAHKKCCTLF